MSVTAENTESRNFTPCVNYLHPDDTIRVSIIKGKKDLVGKYYPQPGKDNAPANCSTQGITCLSRQELNFQHGDIWTATITKICERCIIINYLEKVGEWKNNNKEG